MDTNLEGAANRFRKLASRLRRLGPGISHPKDVHISASHQALIEYAATNPGCGIQEIAEGLKLATPTVSIGVRQMEKNDFFMRQPDPEDGRAVKIFLTSKGQRLHQRSQSFQCQKFERLLTGLTPAERNTLLDLLERAINAAEDEK